MEEFEIKDFEIEEFVFRRFDLKMEDKYKQGNVKMYVHG